jgi:hypothetical protein
VNETHLTPDAKEALRRDVRDLRVLLLDRLDQATRSEYRLDEPDLERAQLPEARRRRRERLEAWIEEQRRGTAPARGGKSRVTAARGPATERRERFLGQAVAQAAYTLLHRLVILRILEHHGALAPAVVTGGWKSPAYANEAVHYLGPLAAVRADDDTRGYRELLDVVFAELALELPGLFGQVGVAPLIPIPSDALGAVIDLLNDPALASAWGDDTTLGWVYQYWNDPERERLDAKIAAGEKILPHEIASKTQMFTERYMVEWLLQNSLGLVWLAICQKNGWQAEARTVLGPLEARRGEWRLKRERGEVAPDALMPVAPGLESDWKYFVDQPIPDKALERAPASIRELRLLDPACGSGHFLVIAFGMLARLYEEEARHRGETLRPEEIAASILRENLFGLDIDPRATQLAAASLWLRAKLYAPGAKLTQVNLVAPAFRLAHLPKDDPALAALALELGALDVPKVVTLRLVEALKGVDHLGSLLRVGGELRAAIEGELGPLFLHGSIAKVDELEARVAAFLSAHAREADLGLRLDGEQLAAGFRFVRLMREGTYDVVVGNPPYQGLSKTADFDYVVRSYPRGKADLYAAFLERGLELVREGGVSAMVTMRGWMFLQQFKELRKHILHDHDLRTLGDFDRGAFDEVPNELLAVCASVIHRARDAKQSSEAILPTPFNDTSYDRQRTNRKRAALLAQVGRHTFDPKGFAVIEGEPIVYWWTKEFLERYAKAPKLGETAPVKLGVQTSDGPRYLRRPWEPPFSATARATKASSPHLHPWAPYLKGAAGQVWIEPLNDLLRWASHGLELKVAKQEQYGSYSRHIQSEERFFSPGVAFSTIGASFSARAHRFPSIIDNMGASVFSDSVAGLTCLLNSSTARFVLQSLNPGIHFLSGDVNRLPVRLVADAETIFASLESAFTEHESHREPSVEFRQPGPSPWRAAQAWAQAAVDRPEGAPLPAYVPAYDPPAPEAALSFAVGVTLGRFDASGEGVLDAAPATALPAGILFVGPDAEGTPGRLADSLDHPAAAPILAAWNAADSAALDAPSLSAYLRTKFFKVHRALYETRPIHFPLSSADKSFVAWINIHRWADATLQRLLADHLLPALRTLDGQLADLSAARATLDKKAAAQAEKTFGRTKRLRDELDVFTRDVRQLAERGAPPADGSSPREVDAPFRMDLDDGVMVNSAALWPVLSPQWADPKKWWKQLASPAGKKDYDWSHLAARYFPKRVTDKCKDDPSLAVAHGCFWRLHPAKAFAWELRLQDEIRPDFRIDEEGSDAARAAFLKDHAAEAEALREKERVRRERKAARGGGEEAEEPEVAGDTEGEDANSYE